MPDFEYNTGMRKYLRLKYVPYYILFGAAVIGILFSDFAIKYGLLLTLILAPIGVWAYLKTEHFDNK